MNDVPSVEALVKRGKTLEGARTYLPIGCYEPAVDGKEAGCTLVGGHTVQDPELKYGLAVTGLVHPDHIYTNAGARSGDLLILTKKLCTGLIANAFKADEIGESDLAGFEHQQCGRVVEVGKGSYSPPASSPGCIKR